MNTPLINAADSFLTMIDNKYYCIDAHCHVFPEKVVDKAVGAIGAFYHIPMEHRGTPENLVMAGDQAGIDHFVIHSVATKPQQVSSANQYLAKVVSEHPGRMTGLGTIHPLSDDMERDINELVSLGLHGIKIHPDMQDFALDCDGFMAAYEICQAKGLPVLAHTGDDRADRTNPNRVEHVLKSFPHLTFVGAHFGGYTVWNEAANILPKYDNLFVDTSSTLFWKGADGMREYIKAYGIDRCMFGTDFPMHRAGMEIKALNYLGFTEEEYVKLYSENARKIYSIK